MTINGRPVSRADIAIIAVVALWAWGVGFWMGSYFVPRSAFETLDARVSKIERTK